MVKTYSYERQGFKFDILVIDHSGRFTYELTLSGGDINLPPIVPREGYFESEEEARAAAYAEAVKIIDGMIDNSAR